MALTIRDYRDSDFKTLLEIDQAAFSEDIAYSSAEMKYYLRSRRCRTFVAEDETGIVGFVIAATERRKYGHIYTIDVAPHRQRRHIGSRLLEAIENWLRLKGVEIIYLETATDESGARGFYERHGYRVADQLAGYYDGTLDAFLMMKSVKQ